MSNYHMLPDAAASASAGPTHTRQGRRGRRRGGTARGRGDQTWRPAQAQSEQVEAVSTTNAIAGQDDAASEELADEAARQSASDGAGAAARQVPFELPTADAKEQSLKASRQPSFAEQALSLACEISRMPLTSAVEYFASQTMRIRPHIALEWLNESSHEFLQRITVAYVMRKAQKLAEEEKGSRFLQEAIKNYQEYCERLPEALARDAAKCHFLCKHKWGNYVMSTLIEVAPMQAVASSNSPPGRCSMGMNEETTRMGPITNVIVENSLDLAQNKFGCRVLQRFIEHCSEDDQRRLYRYLEDELVASTMERTGEVPKVSGLMVDKFGNFVVKTLFEHAPEDVLGNMANRMEDHVVYLAQDPYGTYVVQEALKRVAAEPKEGLETKLRHHEEATRELSRGKHSSYVWKQLIANRET